MQDRHEYLRTIESTAASVPYESDDVLYRRTHDLWGYYADRQMHGAWSLKKCLENCAAVAKRRRVHRDVDFQGKNVT